MKIFESIKIKFIPNIFVSVYIVHQKYAHSFYRVCDLLMMNKSIFSQVKMGVQVFHKNLPIDKDIRLFFFSILSVSNLLMPNSKVKCLKNLHLLNMKRGCLVNHYKILVSL